MFPGTAPMRYIVSILTIMVLGCGCVQVEPIAGLSSGQISEKTGVERDQSGKGVQVEGLKLVFGEFQENHYLLRANRADGQPGVHYAIFMQTLRKSSLGGMGWNAAADESGKPLVLLKQIRQTNEDMLYESVIFELTREWLDAAAVREAKIRIAGATTNQTIVLPTNYVAGFLGRVDQEFLLRN